MKLLHCYDTNFVRGNDLKVDFECTMFVDLQRDHNSVWHASIKSTLLAINHAYPRMGFERVIHIYIRDQLGEDMLLPWKFPPCKMLNIIKCLHLPASFGKWKLSKRFIPYISIVMIVDSCIYNSHVTLKEHKQIKMYD